MFNVLDLFREGASWEIEEIDNGTVHSFGLAPVQLTFGTISVVLG